MPLHFVVSRTSHLGIEQRLERLGQLNADLVAFEEQLGEEGLVEQPTDVVRRLEIGGVSVSQQAQSRVKVALHDLGRGLGPLKPAFDRRQLGADSVLLALQHVERDGIGVVSFEQLGSLLDQALALGRQLRGLGSRLLTITRQLLNEELPDDRPHRVVELDVPVTVGDQLLDTIDQDRLAGAIGCLLVPTKAHKVWIDNAVAVLGVRHDQARAAAAAEDG